ncbi:MAG TPA: LuxR C-terminal-related transcriptional regulator [Gemmatimonadota bacterium]|nr:LuxR C-terminal-related transcriptional regulator [Gemmatimonadota bacterium]
MAGPSRARCSWGPTGTWTRTFPPPSSSRRSAGLLGGELVLAGAPVDWVGSIAEGNGGRRNIESRLTRREQEVLKAAAQDMTAREIARRLGVRERTVTTHLGRIYGKLGVNSRVGAVIEAARSGLVAVVSPESEQGSRST